MLHVDMLFYDCLRLLFSDLIRFHCPLSFFLFSVETADFIQDTLDSRNRQLDFGRSVVDEFTRWLRIIT